MKATWALVASLAGMMATPSLSVGQESPANGVRGRDADRGTVYTFYGLRKLEQDPDVPDAEKLKEWQAFIRRANKQLEYADKAVVRWKNAARRRMVEAASEADRSPKLSPRDKVERWSEIARLYPKTSEARTARRRMTHWRVEETKRLIVEAEKVENADSSHPDRIQAWGAVLSWAKKGPEARAAQRRIQALQRKLYREALLVDRNRRFDAQAKLAAWQNVLAGRPSRGQRATAERKIRALQTQLDRR